ncbi:MAG: hypothetical protein JWM70_1611 [Microbacteriaceae bacterium]|nr:hypothetical protein [Microbacteriaceae bacterium]
MSQRTSPIAAALTLAGLLLLTACTSTPGAQHHPVASSASSTPQPNPAPLPHRALNCAGLVTPTDAATLTGQPVTAVDPAVSEARNATFTQDGVVTTNGMVAAYQFQQLGGLDCEWSNAQYHVEGDPVSHYAGLTASLLFDGAHQPTAADNPFTGDQAPTCDSGGGCRLEEVFGNGMWLELGLELPYDLDHSTPTAASALTALTKTFTATFDRVKSEMQSAAPTTATWSPAETLPLPDECTGVVTLAQVKGALGLPYDLMSSHGDGYVFATTAAVMSLGDSCSWTSATDDHDGIVGSIEMQRAGAWAWAWAKSHALPSALGTPKALQLAGLHEGDGAWVLCDAQHRSCLADVIVGGNWIELRLFDGGPSDQGYGHPTVDRLTAITTLAGQVVTAVRG